MNETINNLATFLEANNIPPEVISVFVSNGITTELFYKLVPEYLRELCPHLGTRIKLLEIITAHASTETCSNEYSESCNIECIDSFSETNSTNPTSSSYAESQKVITTNVLVSRCFPDFDLHTLLQTTVGGNSILKFYETKKILNNTKRNQLTDIIIKHVYTHIVNHKITYEEYNILAAKILTIFPTESIGIYFTRPVPKGQSLTGRPVTARGKLVDKVRNLIFKYGDRKRKSDVLTETEAKKSQTSNIEQVSINFDILWLKTNNEPFDEVINKWKATFEFRQNHSKYPSVHDFFVDWPILNDTRSHSLINIDFETKYPDSALIFFSNFDIEDI
ncbi:hypothetical protein ACJJTC_015307 [Scirpophaga incertulas]